MVDQFWALGGPQDLRYNICSHRLLRISVIISGSQILLTWELGFLNQPCLGMLYGGLVVIIYFLYIHCWPTECIQPYDSVMLGDIYLIGLNITSSTYKPGWTPLGREGWQLFVCRAKQLWFCTKVYHRWWVVTVQADNNFRGSVALYELGCFFLIVY